MHEERIGDWMQTFSGKQFWPIDPRSEEVRVVDISHALSMICRYGGHSLRFYSVAEHCCHLFDAAPDEHKAWALLHDASEAYVIDVPRPLKPFLSEYKGYEKGVMQAICKKFGLSTEEPPIIKELDTRILGDECEQAMATPPAPWYPTGESLGVELRFWGPSSAKHQFLKRFGSLYGFENW